MRLSRTKLLVSVAALLCAAGAATADELTISSKDEFMAFVDRMSEDCSFEGTVVLASDIDFNGTTIAPIGASAPKECVGTFDGQGHVISNLNVDAGSAQYAGLFGAMSAGVVKNVILDGSCSVKATSASGSSGEAYVGGILGAAIQSAGAAATGTTSVTVEDCVNMASVTYDGGDSGSASVCIGGVLGGSTGGAVEVRGCSNYGAVGTAGQVGGAAYLGGIVGRRSAEGSIAIESCVNNGVVRDGSSGGGASAVHAGGIIGSSDAWTVCSVQYCVSAGKVTVAPTATAVANAIAGEVENGTVANCFHSGACGVPGEAGSAAFAIDGDTSAVVAALCEGGAEWSAVTFRYEHGELARGEEQSAMRCNASEGENSAVCARYLVVRKHLPPLAAGERVFAGWFTDATLRSTAAASAEGLEANGTTLYAGFGYRAIVRKESETVMDPLLDAGAAFTVELDNVDCQVLKWNATSAGESGSLCDEEGACRMPAGGVEITVVHIMYTVSLYNSINRSLIEAVPARCGEIFNMEAYEQGEYDGRNFSGWSLDAKCTLVTPVSSPVNQNLSLYGCWGSNRTKVLDESSSSSMGEVKAKSGGSNVGAIVGATVSVLVIVIIAIVVVVFLIMRMRKAAAAAYDDDDEEGYVVEVQKERREGDIEMRERPEVSYVTVIPQGGAAGAFVSLNENKELYPECYHIPTIEEALAAAGLGGEPLKRVAATCHNKAKAVAPSLTEGSGPTEDDIAAVAMYTFDFGARHYESNPFRLINKELAGQDKEGLQRISGMLYLVLTALRKLPRVTKRTLYRGVRQDANIKEGQYAEGSTVTWSAFSSTSPDMNTTKAFLAKGSSDGKAAGTLFIIERGWGYDLQPYSLYPSETEILLEPERQFKVTSVLNGELVIVTLEMIDSPLVLPEIFGEPVDNSV